MNEPVRALKSRGLGVGLISLAATIALLYYGQAFLVALCTAVILNFILEPFVGMLTRVRMPRPLASLVVCLGALCPVYFVGLGVYRQGATLVANLPKYAQRISGLSDGARSKLEGIQQSAEAIVAPTHLSQATPENLPSKTGKPNPPMAPATGVQDVRIHSEHPPIVDFINAHLASMYETILIASFVPFLVYFMLSWRDHLQPAFLQLFEGPSRIAAATSLDGIADMLRAFVVGNFLLGLLMAVVSTCFFWVFPLPYPMLIGPMSGFLSLLPSVGLPLALLPPLLTALAVYGTPAPYLIIAGGVALLHLLAMNVLYPKIVGPRVHLNPLVVAVALMFWSALWGASGLILAIPLTAGIKAVCDHVEALERYGRLLGD